MFYTSHKLYLNIINLKYKSVYLTINEAKGIAQTEAELKEQPVAVIVNKSVVLTWSGFGTHYLQATTQTEENVQLLKDFKGKCKVGT